MFELFPRQPGPRESGRTLETVIPWPAWVTEFAGKDFVIEAQEILHLILKSTIVTTTVGRNKLKLKRSVTKNADCGGQTIIVPGGSVGKAMDKTRFYISNCIADSRYGKAESLVQLTFEKLSINIRRYPSNGYATILRDGDTYTVRNW